TGSTLRLTIAAAAALMLAFLPGTVEGGSLVLGRGLLLAALSALLCGPVLADWVAERLEEPLRALARHPGAQLEIEGTRGLSVAAAGLPAQPLPARLAVGAGRVTITVASAGRRRAFAVTTGTRGRLAGRFAAAE